MKPTLQKGPPSTPLNSLAPRMAKASIGLNPPVNIGETACSDDCVSLVFEALAAVGMSDKEAAYEMAMDPAQLSRVKSRQARLSLDALWRLPDRFWFEFRDRVDERRNLTVAAGKQTRLARIKELALLLVEEAAS